MLRAKLIGILSTSVPNSRRCRMKTSINSAGRIGYVLIASELDTSKPSASLYTDARLLHRESAPVKVDTEPPAPSQAVVTVGSTPAATALRSNLLLMTSRVLIKAPDGSLTEARALLDNASCASFISERLAQSLSLHRKHVPVSVSGIGGLSHKPPPQSVTTFEVQSLSGRKIEVIAVIVPKVTCDLPTAPVAFDLRWDHLNGIPLVDPSFGQPGRVDMLLGADIFVDVLRDGRRKGPDDAPTAFETDFGWVLCGSTGSPSVSTPVHVASFYTSVESPDDILKKFWELEESPTDDSCMSVKERLVLRHFECNHRRSKEGRFVVPLPRDPSVGALGESRTQAVKRFMSLERSLNRRGGFEEFNSVMQEYFKLGHAEVVPAADLEKPPPLTFYLPICTLCTRLPALLQRLELSLTPLQNRQRISRSMTPC